MHDTRASIALQKNALVSLTEFSFSVPASRSLFMASSAEQWKSIYIETCLSHHPLPPLGDVMHDVHMLDNLSKEIDVDLCYASILHSFWSQVSAFRQSVKFHNISENGDSVHRLWMTSQQLELYREIEAFKSRLLATADPQQELIMTAELFLMILYVYPEELQRFAGKNGEDAASQAATALQEWSVTPHARRAVWHAGQVFRRAALMPPTELRDFFTIAVYFASLTLWAYGHLLLTTSRDTRERSESNLQSHGGSNLASRAVLDGPESQETRTFILKGIGTPGLASMNSPSDLLDSGRSNSFVELGNPNAVLERARSVYRGNFPVFEEPLPPLVENIGNLLKDLSSLSEDRFSKCTSPIER